MNKKNGIILLVFLMISIMLSGCKDRENAKTVGEFNNGKLKVAVSFNPIREFAAAIGGEKVSIVTIVNDGTEPHDFEIMPQNMKSLSEASVFIYNGLGMEPWVKKALDSINNSKLIVVEASKNCNKIKNSDNAEISEHGEYDPHTWLSLLEAKKEALSIKEAFVKADESNRDYYEKNYKEFAEKIDSLYEEYKTKYSSLSNVNFVTGHAAFSYLCRDFQLKQNSVESVFGEGEPTAAKISELVDYCRKNNVKTVFAENMASPKVSETLAREIDGKVQKIYTLESKEDGKDYLESMRENLERIYNSLK